MPRWKWASYFGGKRGWILSEACRNLGYKPLSSETMTSRFTGNLCFFPFGGGNFWRKKTLYSDIINTTSFVLCLIIWYVYGPVMSVTIRTKQQKYYRLGDLNNKHLSPIVLEAVKSRIKVLARFNVYWEPCSWFTARLLTGFSCDRKRMREQSGVPFIRTLTLFMRAPYSWPNHLPRVPVS